MHSSHHRLGGFTVSEILFASALSAVVAAGCFSILLFILRTTTHSFYMDQLARDDDQLSQRVANDIRASVSLEASYGAYSSNNNILILKLAAIDAAGNPVDIQTKFDYVIYRPDGSNPVLLRQVFPNASSSRRAGTMVIGNLVHSESYKGTFAAKQDAMGASVVHYQFMLTKTYQGRQYSLPVSGSVRLRNKA